MSPRNLNPKTDHLKPLPRADNTQEELTKPVGLRLEKSVYEALVGKYPGKGELTAWLRKKARICAEDEGLLQ
ncbi:hypothetical protein HRE53_32045 (plasmid) [Acaryochloris sp. 'Moss Beach']|uniref:hypothetical protein n=1 Tax=Acaryochloris sp. 'Moss Beach' TaxID=2740837 RepID=UPI001F38B38C|nr:hypothetical protein [Acaryochloris sp. 'Moss Beach']UJB73203.1 hypothetical protein HRE53_32045 [Acaryochloris sp. 'Moss Beach']